jgi:hypothetical protein
LPAFVASRIASIPHVASLAQHLEDAELSTVAAVMRKYDDRTNQALIRLVGTLGPDVGIDMVDELEDLASQANDQWTSLFTHHGRDR